MKRWIFLVPLAGGMAAGWYVWAHVGEDARIALAAMAALGLSSLAAWTFVLPRQP